MKFIQWIRTQANRLPAPWNYVVQAGLVIVVLVIGVYIFGQVQSCGYDKARKQYETEKQSWTVERSKLIGAAEEKERQVAELEVKVQAFNAAAEAGKKVDEALADKIDQLGKDTANAEANANVPVDCAARASRICAMFRASDKRFDCKPIFDACPK